MAKGKLKAKFKKAKGKAKASSKNFMNNIKEPAMDAGLIAAGLIGSNQFLSLQDIMKDQYAKDPNAFYFKHEGAIKVLLPLITIGMWKTMPRPVKMILIGVMVQGAIQELREVTKDSSGTSKVKQIGDTDVNKALEGLAAEIKSVAEQSRTNVGGPEARYNSNTSVGNGGMGMGEDLVMY